jgi:Fur family ferric uptake transcriptional regulator
MLQYENRSQIERKNERKTAVKYRYTTPARRALLDFFASRPDRQFTAEQLCTLLCDTGDRASTKGDKKEFLGKSTVYRQLAQLCEEGLLLRFEGVTAGGATVHWYQYRHDALCDGHFHLKCTRCGRLEHLDCEHAQALLAHIQAEHGFSVDCGGSVLLGICNRCGGK